MILTILAGRRCPIPNGFPVGAALAALALTVAGCGSSDKGSVSGTVTLDEQPLAGAFVRFAPEGDGSPSLARTDATGKYTLEFSRSESGAMIGEHVVSISTFATGDPDSDPPTPAVPEKVPVKYNLQTELKVKVDAGDNVHDFVLTSDGPVVQPDSIVDPDE